ncbi:UNVERIFIED_CONTAM: Ribosomal RNA processing protein 1 B [Siphonaria sp. JEL0065]|nr:Ribosomal RNA processing protein 1 B [Siphonaria sp. JEL0065]
MSAAAGGGFGKNLAHTDKSVRDKAVKALSEWLIGAENMDITTMTKLWKGLFYCYWMSDKPLIQHELAERLAKIILEVDSEKALLYITAFWKIMILEWPGLDRLRLDKFYNLLRNFHRYSFILIEKNEFDEEIVGKYVALLEEGPVSPNNIRVPDSLKYHTAEVYLDEMNNGITGGDLPTEIGVKLLSPFIKAFATTTNQIYVGKIEELFGKVVDVLDNNVRYEDEPEKKEFAVSLNNTRVCQEIYSLIDLETTLFRNRKSLNVICSRFFKEGGVKVEDVKGVQAPVQVGLRPLFAPKPTAEVATPAAPVAKKKEPVDVAPVKPAKESPVVLAPVKAAKESPAPVTPKVKESSPVTTKSTKESATKSKSTPTPAPSAPATAKTPDQPTPSAKAEKKKSLKRPADELKDSVAPELVDEPVAQSPPKKAKLSQLSDSFAIMKPQAVAIATRINTQKNAKPIPIKATPAEIEELKKKALEAKRAGKSITPQPKQPKRNIVLKLENNTVKTFDMLTPIGMIPIEIPPFSPSASVLKLRK